MDVSGIRVYVPKKKEANKFRLSHDVYTGTRERAHFTTHPPSRLAVHILFGHSVEFCGSCAHFCFIVNIHIRYVSKYVYVLVN